MGEQIPRPVYVALGCMEEPKGTFQIKLIGVFDDALRARDAALSKGISAEQINVVGCFPNARHFIPAFRIVTRAALEGAEE